MPTVNPVFDADRNAELALTILAVRSSFTSRPTSNEVLDEVHTRMKLGTAVSVADIANHLATLRRAWPERHDQFCSTVHNNRSATQSACPELRELPKYALDEEAFDEVWDKAIDTMSRSGDTHLRAFSLRCKKRLPTPPAPQSPVPPPAPPPTTTSEEIKALAKTISSLSYHVSKIGEDISCPIGLFRAALGTNTAILADVVKQQNIIASSLAMTVQDVHNTRALAHEAYNSSKLVAESLAAAMQKYEAIDARAAQTVADLQKMISTLVGTLNDSSLLVTDALLSELRGMRAEVARVTGHPVPEVPSAAKLTPDVGPTLIGARTPAESNGQMPTPQEVHGWKAQVGGRWGPQGPRVVLLGGVGRDLQRLHANLIYVFGSRLNHVDTPKVMEYLEADGLVDADVLVMLPYLNDEIKRVVRERVKAENCILVSPSTAVYQDVCRHVFRSPGAAKKETQLS